MRLRTCDVDLVSCGKAIYDCSRSLSDHVAISRCRSVIARVVDRVVGASSLGVLAPEEITLALAAAQRVRLMAIAP